MISEPIRGEACPHNIVINCSKDSAFGETVDVHLIDYIGQVIYFHLNEKTKRKSINKKITQHGIQQFYTIDESYTWNLISENSTADKEVNNFTNFMRE